MLCSSHRNPSTGAMVHSQPILTIVERIGVLYSYPIINAERSSYVYRSSLDATDHGLSANNRESICSRVNTFPEDGLRRTRMLGGTFPVSAVVELPDIVGGLPGRIPRLGFIR